MTNIGYSLNNPDLPDLKKNKKIKKLKDLKKVNGNLVCLPFFFLFHTYMRKKK